MPLTATSESAPKLSALQLFGAFLLIGATSFGGGVIAHLRSSIVVNRRWTDEETFIELLTISQTLPGLKAVNLAMLLGDRLRGTLGAVVAIAGVSLPGALLMYVVGVMYQVERERPYVPAAVGLILATTVQLWRSSFARIDDFIFIALTVICINRLHVSVPHTLLGIGVLAVVWYAGVRRGRGQTG